jgi:hypothetical protein
MAQTENKIPAFPVLEPLSKATATALAPMELLDTDFLEIDIAASEARMIQTGKRAGESASVDNDMMHFEVQAVCLKRCPTNILPSIDRAADPKYVQTPQGAFYKDDVHYHYPSWNASSAWFSRVPERKQLGYGKWKLAGTDYTALIIHHAWPHDNLIFKSEAAQLLYTYLLRRFYMQSSAATIAAKFKLTGEVPEMPKDFIPFPKGHPELELTDYQKVALMISLNNPAYALFMEQGTGKTAIMIARICLEAARKRARNNGTGGMYRALIVCPKQVRLNWKREFRRFATSPGKTCILRGGKLKMIRTLTDSIRDETDCAWSVCMISIDSVVTMWDAFKRMKWDFAGVDESHRIKNPGTNRFKALMDIDEIHAAQKMIATGTPITNTVFDLWGQFQWLGNGLSGFSTFPNYRSFHGKWKDAVAGGNGLRKLDGFKNLPLVQERLARLSFLMREDETGNQLPEKVFNIYEVTMTTPQADVYKRIAKKLVAEIDDMLEMADATGKSITVECILTKMIRLAQITSGFIKTDDEEDLDLETVTPGQIYQIGKKNPKLDAVVEMIREDWEQDCNSKCIIWATFIEDLRAISERLAAECINHAGYHKVIQAQYRVKDAERAEDKINFDDSCRILVVNPASAGEGLNLLGYDKENPDASSMYVNHNIYFSRNWSYVQWIQSLKRSHRRGTRAPVRYTALVVPNSIDIEMHDRVTGKGNMANSIQDIRDILNSVLKGYRT